MFFGVGTPFIPPDYMNRIGDFVQPLPEELVCVLCGRDIEEDDMYMILNDIPAYADVTCIYNRLLELDETDPIKDIMDGSTS
jgi:hypothetical protein